MKNNTTPSSEKTLSIRDKPMFSVIVPTYNRAHLLKNTLLSVFNQTFTDFELILVDDGSTDHTTELIETEFAHEKRLRYCKKRNEERSVARNYGIARAEGEYILFFDSDDWMKPNHLETLYNTIQKNPDAKFLATKFDFKSQGKVFPSHLAHLPQGYYDYTLLLEGSHFNALVCFQRSLIDSEVGLQPFPIEFSICEDWIFLLRNLFLHQSPIYVIDKATVTVNDHPERSMKNNQKVIAARLRAMEVLLQELQLPADEERLLKGHSYRFCAVHAYLDHQRKQAFSFWKQTITYLGFSTNTLVLGIKILLGKKWISKLT